MVDRLLVGLLGVFLETLRLKKSELRGLESWLWGISEGFCMRVWLMLLYSLSRLAGLMSLVLLDLHRRFGSNCSSLLLEEVNFALDPKFLSWLLFVPMLSKGLGSVGLLFAELSLSGERRSLGKFLDFFRLVVLYWTGDALIKGFRMRLLKRIFDTCESARTC